MTADDATLAAAGFQPAGGGEVLLAGPAARLFGAWLGYLQRLLRPFHDISVRAPLFLPRQALEDARYLRHFPQHLFRSSNPMGADERYVTPAACLHLYPSLAHRRLNAPYSALILARCARYEAGNWDFPFRLAAFHMLELVVVGEPELVAQQRRAVAGRLQAALADLGLAGTFAPATDAFFLGDGEGARIIQKLKELKWEYIVAPHGARAAVASVNDHEDYFGQCFDIRLGDRDEYAASFCIAFGLERLTACGLLAWGAAAADWPAELRT